MSPKTIQAIRAAIRMPTSASDVAMKTKVPVEAVYQALVRMEALGEAQVRIDHGAAPHRRISVEWVAA